MSRIPAETRNDYHVVSLWAHAKRQFGTSKDPTAIGGGGEEPDSTNKGEQGRCEQLNKNTKCQNSIAIGTSVASTNGQSPKSCPLIWMSVRDDRF